MKETTRRRFLAGILPSAAALGIVGAKFPASEQSKNSDAASTAKLLNLYCEGPFGFFMHPTAGVDGYVDLLAPCVPGHAIASISSINAEAPMPLGDLTLTGVKPEKTPKLPSDTYIQPPKVANVSSRKRYFRLKLPMPISILPLNPVNAKIYDSNIAGTKSVPYAVGLLFIYEIAADNVEILNGNELIFEQNTSPVPISGQNHIDVHLHLGPESAKPDKKHTHATKAFSELQKVLSLGERKIKYDQTYPDVSTCNHPAKKVAFANWKSSIFFLPGHNCRAPVIVVAQQEP